MRLSQRLKAETAAAHARVERLVGLERSDFDVGDWVTHLQRMHRVVAPTEQAVRAVPEVACWLPEESLNQGAALLASDLAALGAEPLTPLEVEPLESLEAAIGALYVMEGSALGGAVILRLLRPRMGSTLAVSDRFHGRLDRGRAWRALVSRIDAHGAQHDQRQAGCVRGAQRTFTDFARSFADG